MPHSDIRVGPVLASTIYLFDPSAPGPKSGKEELTLTQLRGAPPRFENNTQETRIDKHEQVWILKSHRRLLQ